MRREGLGKIKYNGIIMEPLRGRNDNMPGIMFNFVEARVARVTARAATRAGRRATPAEPTRGSGARVTKRGLATRRRGGARATCPRGVANVRREGAVLLLLRYESPVGSLMALGQQRAPDVEGLGKR